MKYNETLKNWLAENVVRTYMGEYRGVEELDLVQLGALQVLVKAAITEKINEKDS